MSLYSKRRGRRSLAAIAAAMLMASVLAVVAGSPAQAANTASEVLVDHDSNAATASVREFAGQDRYDTALRLAKNFATSKGGLGAVPMLFVSSGETLVDSISVAGLAGYSDAPIVLTPSGMLHGGVADFVEDYGVETVYVLGGAAAVSDSVVTALEGLNAEPEVMRISGDDRYATAAAIASKIDSEASWCGSSAAGAVLINGATDMMPYGVAVQTIAYRLQMPVLMTEADMVPMATSDFITDNDIEHIQIIGGTGTVSADVASELTSLGVDTVERIDGDSASAVSVALAELAANGCSDALGLVSADHVALVRGNPDGVVGAPVLASSLGSGYLVPPLVVGDSLPASVRDYLAATPKTVGGNNLDLRIVAIGGNAAVSESTMMAALDAAASSGALTVAIGAASDTNGDGATNASDPVRPQDLAASPQFTLYFSDGVSAALAKLQDVIEVNGVPAVVSAATSSTTGGACDNRRIDVTLGQSLRAGDEISLVPSSHKFGIKEDQRTVASASATVTAPPADRARPTASVLGIAQASPTAFSAFTVMFADAGGFAAMEANALQTSAFALAQAAGASGGAVASPVHGAVTAGATSFSVTVPIGRELVAGDRLIVNPGVVKDLAGNTNAGTSRSAFNAQPSPAVQTVYMSALKHSAQAKWTVPTALVGGAASDHAILITAKGDGDAAGAAGNGWTMVFDRASTYSAAKPLDIDVRVDTRGQRVTVRFNNGPDTATLGDLLAALKANSDFDARFNAGFEDCATGEATTRLGLLEVRDQVVNANGDGRTQFAIEVRFNAQVRSVVSDGLLIDILAAAASRAGTDNSESGIRATASGGGGTAAGGGLTVADDLSVDSSVLTDPLGGPRQLVRYEFETALVKNLPMSRDLVQIDAGHTGAGAITGPPSYPAIPPTAAIALGYAVDAPTGDDNSGAQDTTDEDKNAGNQRRITVTSNVKTP
ncbi:MAG: cell wall-binding repeat-containing protein [Acidimicrobiales bacterium]|nr:cell wall-binding repeat-containing protein [Acidimicrobiales bacterium]